MTNDKPKPEYRKLPAAEQALVKALNTCVFLPGSYDKRFVREMSGAKIVTEKQLRYLYATAHRYRRQMGAGNISDLWKLIADGKYPRWGELVEPRDNDPLCVCGHPDSEHEQEDTCTKCNCDNFKQAGPHVD